MRDHAEASKALRDQWHFLDRCAQKLFHSNYWNLDDKTRVKVHSAINGDAAGYGDLKTAGLLENMPGVRNGSFGGYPMPVTLKEPK